MAGRRGGEGAGQWDVNAVTGASQVGRGGRRPAGRATTASVAMLGRRRMRRDGTTTQWNVWSVLPARRRSGATASIGWFSKRGFHIQYECLILRQSSRSRVVGQFHQPPSQRAQGRRCLAPLQSIIRACLGSSLDRRLIGGRGLDNSARPLLSPYTKGEKSVCVKLTDVGKGTVATL